MIRSRSYLYLGTNGIKISRQLYQISELMKNKSIPAVPRSVRALDSAFSSGSADPGVSGCQYHKLEGTLCILLHTHTHTHILYSACHEPSKLRHLVSISRNGIVKMRSEERGLKCTRKPWRIRTLT